MSTVTILTGQKVDEQGCVPPEEIEMAFSYPPDGWQLTGTNVTWGSDVLEGTTVDFGKIGDTYIKLTGSTPTTEFGIQTTDTHMVVLEELRTYRLKVVVRAS